MDNVDDCPRQPPDRDAVAIAFLKKVLPPHGRYCAFVKIRGGKKFNRFFETVEELWEYMRETDRDGHEVYFALGSYGEDGDWVAHTGLRDAASADVEDGRRHAAERPALSGMGVALVEWSGGSEYGWFAVNGGSSAASG